MILPLIVVAAAVSGQTVTFGPGKKELLSQIVSSPREDVSPARLKSDVETLVSFGTRHTLSDATSPTHGIGAARNWIKSEFEKTAAKSGGRMTVSFEEFDVPEGRRIPKGGAHLVNVMAVLRPAADSIDDRRIYIVGHYDSRNGGENDITADAPGANDDASGTAAVLEAARVLAASPPGCTIVFLAVAGEEQGLYGSQYRASQAASAHETIVAVLNNDIIGDPGLETGGSADEVRVFSEGIPRNPSAEKLAEIRAASAESDSTSRQLARFISEVSFPRLVLKPRMIFRPDRFLRGGDHSSFNEAGFPAVRFTSSSEVYARQHANVTEKDGKPYGDVPSFVDFDYLAGVTKINVATIYAIAAAPPSPENARIITAELGNNTVLRWTNTPKTDHYELVWRATTEATWTHSLDVGTRTEVSVNTSKDDHFFGVRSVSADGHKSIVSFAWQAKK